MAQSSQPLGHSFPEHLCLQGRDGPVHHREGDREEALRRHASSQRHSLEPKVPTERGQGFPCWERAWSPPLEGTGTVLRATWGPAPDLGAKGRPLFSHGPIAGPREVQGQRGRPAAPCPARCTEHQASREPQRSPGCGSLLPPPQRGSGTSQQRDPRSPSRPELPSLLHRAASLTQGPAWPPRRHSPCLRHLIATAAGANLQHLSPAPAW